MTELSYCAEQIKDFDNDRYVAALFADEVVREDLFALYAFNLELSKIRETVSEPMIGRMRLQFWRDAIPRVVAGDPPKHAVAEPLAMACQRRSLPESELLALIDAREADLDDIAPISMAAVEAYAESTSSALIGLAMRIVGVDPSKYSDFVRDSGIAIALVGLVRAIPFQASSGRVTLPADLCQVAGLDPTQSHQWPRNPNVSEITLPMLVTAKRHLEAARKSSHQLPRIVMPAVLPLSLSALYLRALQRYGGDPKTLAERPIGLPRHLTLMWRSMLGRP